MFSSSPIIKQLLVNKIAYNKYMPYDIVDLIKSFSFLDMKTYNMIQTTKKYKKKIHDVIKYELIFFQYIYFHNDKYSHWGVQMVMPTDDTIILYINNDFCNYCGNYCQDYFTHENNHIPRNIKCTCPN